MNYENCCVKANNYEEALEKWRKGLTVAKEKELANDKSLSVKVEGNKTIVTTADGKVGVAKCHHDDAFDVLEGIKVALEHIKTKYRKLTDTEYMLLQYLKTMGCDKICIKDMGLLESDIAIFAASGKTKNGREISDVAIKWTNDFKWLEENKPYLIKDLLENNK